MYKLDFVVNGGWIFPIGVYETKEDVKQAIYWYIYSYSAIQRPVFRTSGSDDVKRVDYGACDCYFLVKAELDCMAVEYHRTKHGGS